MGKLIFILTIGCHSCEKFATIDEKELNNLLKELNEEEKLDYLLKEWEEEKIIDLLKEYEKTK